MAAVRNILADRLLKLVVEGTVGAVMGKDFADLTQANITAFRRQGAWNNNAQECAMKLACALLAVGIVCMRDLHPAFRITGRSSQMAPSHPQINLSCYLVQSTNHFDVAIPIAQIQPAPAGDACPFALWGGTLTPLLSPLRLRVNTVPGLRSCVFEALVDAYIEAGGPTRGNRPLKPFGMELHELLRQHTSGRVGQLPPIPRGEVVALLRMRAIDAILESRNTDPTRSAMHPTDPTRTAWQWLQQCTRLNDTALVSALNVELRAEDRDPHLALAEEILPVLAHALDCVIRVVDGTRNRIEAIRNDRPLVLTLVRAGVPGQLRYASTRAAAHPPPGEPLCCSSDDDADNSCSSSSESDGDLSCLSDYDATWSDDASADDGPSAPRRGAFASDKLHVRAAADVVQREDVQRVFSVLTKMQHTALVGRYNSVAKRKFVERDGKRRSVVPWFALGSGNELQQLLDYDLVTAYAQQLAASDAPGADHESPPSPRKGSRRWLSAAGLIIDYAQYKACCGQWANACSQAAAAPSKEEHPSSSIEAMFAVRLSVREMVKDKRQFRNYVASALASRTRSDKGPEHDRVAMAHGTVCTSCYRALLGVGRTWLFGCVQPAPMARTHKRKGPTALTRRKLVARLLHLYCRDLAQFDPAGSRSKSQFRQVWHLPQFTYRQLCDDLNADLEQRLVKDAALRSQLATLGAKPGQRLVTESTLRRVTRSMQKGGVHISLSKSRGVCACGDCASLQAQLSRTVAGTDVHAAIMRQKQEHSEAVKLQRAHFNRRKLEALQDPRALWTVTFDGFDQSKTALPHRPQMSKGTDSLQHIGVHVVGVYAFGAPLPVLAYFNNETVAKDSNLSVTILFDILDKQWRKLQEDYTKAAEVSEQAAAAAAGGGEAAASAGPAQPAPDLTAASSAHAARNWPRHLHLTFDNTVSESKNQHFFRAAAALVHFGVFEAITVSNMLVGHTHDIVDQMFSVWAIALNIRCVHTLAKMKRLFRQAYGTRIKAISELFCKFKFKTDPDAKPTEEELAGVQNEMSSLEITQKEFLEFLAASGTERHHLAAARSWDDDVIRTMKSMAHELSDVAPEMFDIEYSINVKKWFEDNSDDLGVRVNFKRIKDAFVFGIEKDPEDGGTYLYSRFLADFDNPMEHEGIMHHYPNRKTGNYSTRSIMFTEQSKMPKHPTRAPLREFDRALLNGTVEAYDKFKLLRPEEVAELKGMLAVMAAAVDERVNKCAECKRLSDDYHSIGVIHQKAGASEAEQAHAREQQRKRAQSENALKKHLNDPAFGVQHRALVDTRWWQQWMERAPLIQKSYNQRDARITEKQRLLRTTHAPFHAHPKELCTGFGEPGVRPAMQRVDCQWLEKHAPPKVGDMVVVRSAGKNDAFELGIVLKLLSNASAPGLTAKRLEHLGRHAERIDQLNRNAQGDSLMRVAAHGVDSAVRNVPNNQIHRTALAFMHLYWREMCVSPTAATVPAVPSKSLLESGVGNPEWRQWWATQRCYEVRASRAVPQRLNAPTQVGLFATRSIKKGDLIEWYGGIIVWGERETTRTTHARTLGSHAPGFVQDGWPMAAAVTRYVASTPEALPQQLLLPAADFHPRKQYESDATLEAMNLILQYDSMPLGFLVNSAVGTAHTENARVVAIPVSARRGDTPAAVADESDRQQGKQSPGPTELAQIVKALKDVNVGALHMLQASRDIAPGEELLTNYKSHEERSGFTMDQALDAAARPEPPQHETPVEHRQSSAAAAASSPPPAEEQAGDESEQLSDKSPLHLEHLPLMCVRRWEYNRDSLKGKTTDGWDKLWKKHGEAAESDGAVKPGWLVDLFEKVKFLPDSDKPKEPVIWNPSSLILWDKKENILTDGRLKVDKFKLVRADLTGTEVDLAKPKKSNKESADNAAARPGAKRSRAPRSESGANKKSAASAAVPAPPAAARPGAKRRALRIRSEANAKASQVNQKKTTESSADDEDTTDGAASDDSEYVEPNATQANAAAAAEQTDAEADAMEDTENFEVESIVRHRRRSDGCIEYLVKWKDYALDERDTQNWLTVEQFNGSLELLLGEFRQAQAAATAATPVPEKKRGRGGTRR
jgi:hypothetical protein